MKAKASRDAVMSDEAVCFDCDNRECVNFGHDVMPFAYCPKQPIVDRYKKGETMVSSGKCRTCLYRVRPDMAVSGPCLRCTNAQVK